RKHLYARSRKDAGVRAGDGGIAAGTLDREDRGAVRADIFLSVGPPGDVVAGRRRRRPTPRSRARHRAVDRALRPGRRLHQRASAGAAVPFAHGRGRHGPGPPRAPRHARPGRGDRWLARALARRRLGPARMRSPARLRLVVVLLVVVVAAGGLAGVAIWQASPGSLVARKGHLAAVEITPAGEDAISTMSQVTLPRSTGREVTALVGVPRGAGPHPAAVLLGGVNRGRRVAAVRGLDAIARHAVIVSPDYPLPARRGGWEGWRAITMPFKLRPAAFD